MPPSALALALFIIEEAIKLAPSISTELQALLTKPDPTPGDWAALRATVSAKRYEDYVPDTVLPPSLPPETPPAAAPPPALPPGDPAPAPAIPATQVFTGQATDPHA